MADTNVKIKLTADGKQVRSELKLIDRELQELGGKEVKGKPKTKQQGEKSERDKANEARTNAKQESRDKVTESLYKEASLIRKELQKLNKSGVGGQSSGGSTTPPSSNGGDNGGSTPNIPSGGGSGDGGNGSKIASALGKLAMAGAAIKVLSSAINSLNSSAMEAQAGESLAYKTYGSTLAYTDYNDARKDASNIGSPYGFDYETVMSAGKANMSKAGFTTLANYEADMTGILQTSKAWGIDTSNLGETSGFMSSIGVTKSGDQTRFANILAESIVDAQMTGREDEQLQVLEQIAESLASVNTTVSEKNVTDQLNLYNALISQNENLKGSRGASLIESASDLARSGDTSLDILAGLNTEFTGKSGYIELRKMAEENPTEYWRRVVNGARQYGYDDEDIKYKLLKSSGLSTSQIDDLLSGIDNVENFKMEDTTEGEKATQERTENYQGSDVFTQEQYDIEKKEASDDRGNFWNDIKNPFRSLYNNAPDWAKQIFNGVDFGVKAGGTILGAKGLSSLAGKLFGGGSAASGGGGFVSSILGKFGFGSSAAAGGTAAAEGAAATAAGAAGATEAGAAAGSLAAGEAAAAGAGEAALAGEAAAGSAAAGGTAAAEGAAATAAGAAGATEAGAAAGSLAAGEAAAAGAGEAALAGEAAAGSAAAGGGALSTAASVALPLAIAAQGFLIGTDIDEDNNVKLTYGDVSKSVFVQAAKDIKQQSEDAEENYGSMWAADWNPLKGLWRKDGTIWQQKQNGTYGKKHPDAKSDILNSETGDYYTYRELDDIEAQNAKNSIQWSKDNADDVEAFKRSLANSVDKNGNIDLSFMEGVDVATAQELFKSVFGTDVFTSGKLQGMSYMMSPGSTLSDVDFGKSEENWYANQLKDSGLFDDFIKDNQSLIDTESTLTESVDTLATEVSEMRKWLEDNGYQGTAVWTDETVKKTYNEQHSNSSATTETTSLNPMSNTKNQGTKWQWWNPFTWFGTSHATGNDYVPYDNYLASLHKGEMVLTSFEADQYRQGKVDKKDDGFGTSHATGNDYVPYDNYLASLHKGEMVLTSFEADQYRQGKVDKKDDGFGTSHALNLNLNITGAINGLTAENQNMITQAIIAELSQGGLTNMISNGFQRVQNY